MPRNSSLGQIFNFVIAVRTDKETTGDTKTPGMNLRSPFLEYLLSRTHFSEFRKPGIKIGLLDHLNHALVIGFCEFFGGLDAAGI